MTSVIDDLSMAADSDKAPALILLDLSAAFDTVDHMDCRVYNYSDDTQLLLCPEGSAQSYHKAQTIFRFISKWMSSNFLNLNPDKTEIVVVQTRRHPWSDLYCPRELGIALPLLPPQKAWAS